MDDIVHYSTRFASDETIIALHERTMEHADIVARYWFGSVLLVCITILVVAALFSFRDL